MKINLTIQLDPEYEPQLTAVFSADRSVKLSLLGRDTEAEAGRAAIALAQLLRDGMRWLSERVPSDGSTACKCMYRFSDADIDGNCTVCGNPWLHRDGEVTADEDKADGNPLDANETGNLLSTDDPYCKCSCCKDRALGCICMDSDPGERCDCAYCAHILRSAAHDEIFAAASSGESEKKS